MILRVLEINKQTHDDLQAKNLQSNHINKPRLEMIVLANNL